MQKKIKKFDFIVLLLLVSTSRNLVNHLYEKF